MGASLSRKRVASSLVLSFCGESAANLSLRTMPQTKAYKKTKVFLGFFFFFDDKAYSRTSFLIGINPMSVKA